MEAFGLKAFWLVLCVLGTMVSWIVLVTMAASINIYWLPILYCIGLTVLEGVFCLGLTFRMDPFHMPRSFCHFQIFAISLSALFLTGVCLTIMLALTTSIIWPSPSDTPQSILRWRKHYLIPLVLIPVILAFVQLGLVVQFDAAEPSDNLQCDVTGPKLWISLFGYSGMPMLESLPCLIINILAGVRVVKMFKASQRDATQPSLQDLAQFGLTLAGRSRINQRILKASITGPFESMPPPMFGSSLPPLPRPSARPSRPATILSFYPQLDQPHTKSPIQPHDSFTPSFPRTRERYAHLDPSLRILSVRNIKPVPQYPRISGSQKSDLNKAWDSRSGDSRNMSAETPHWARNPFAVQTFDSKLAQEEQGKSDKFSWPAEVPAPQDDLFSLTWHLILFFCLFFLLQILVTLSALIDIAHSRRTPPPFGPLHVTLLFASWGPGVIFLHLPGIRRRLTFWRP